MLLSFDIAGAGRHDVDVMKKMLGAALVTSLILAPVVASAAVIDASLIPDGTYVVKVEKVQDAQHVLVAMQNGMETTLATASNFSNVKSNDTIKVTLIQGKVRVFAVQ
jgi:hypothetical protein